MLTLRVLRSDKMNVKRRLQMIKIAEKIERNPAYSEKLGVQDKSFFRPARNVGERKYIC